MVRLQISAEMMRLMCLCACVRCGMPEAIIPGAGGLGNCPEGNSAVLWKNALSTKFWF